MKAFNAYSQHLDRQTHNTGSRFMAKLVNTGNVHAVISKHQYFINLIIAILGITT